MNVNSELYPLVDYTPGEDLDLFQGDAELPFDLSVSEELTASADAMDRVAAWLDEAEAFAEAARNALTAALEHEGEEPYNTLRFFLDFHREELGDDLVKAMFPGEPLNELTDERMIEFLAVRRFAAVLSEETGEEAVQLDLGFNPEVTDEVLLVELTPDREVTFVEHES